MSSSDNTSQTSPMISRNDGTSHPTDHSTNQGILDQQISYDRTREETTRNPSATTNSAGDEPAQGDKQAPISDDETVSGSSEGSDDTLKGERNVGHQKSSSTAPAQPKCYIPQEERLRLKLQKRVDSWVDDPGYLSNADHLWDEPRPRTPNSDNEDTDQGSGAGMDSRLMAQNRLGTELKPCQARSDCPPIMPHNEETRTVSLLSPQVTWLIYIG